VDPSKTEVPPSGDIADGPSASVADDATDEVVTVPPDADNPFAGDSGVPSARKRAKKAAWLSTLEWVGLIIGAIVIALLLKTFLFQAFYIPSESMMPTLEKNDRVLVNKLSYKLHDVHRGDIVVFKAPPGVDPGVKDLVKRVIGLPGDTIEGRNDGFVYINGAKLEEKWLPEGEKTEPGFAPVTVPADSYFVMGDNRGNSKDSRFFKPTPFIKEEDIVGRVFLRIWPLNRGDIL
jgi:signal peptidase I